MKSLRLKTAHRHAAPNRRAERRSFFVLIVLTAAIWFASTAAVQWVL